MPHIFISYRRDDSKSTTGRLHDWLVPVFGKDSIFMDVENISLGADFRTYLQNEIAKADIVLIIIGPEWASILKNRRRDPNDFVRIELESALEQRKITIPVLVDGAKMPKQRDLPKRVASVFSYLNAASLGDGPAFQNDVKRLIAKLQNLEALPLPPELPPIQTKSESYIKISLWFAALIMILLIGSSVYIWRIYFPNIFGLQVTPTREIAEIISSTPTKTVEMNTTSTSSSQPTDLPTNAPIPPVATTTNTVQPTAIQTDNPTITNTPIPPVATTTNTVQPTATHTDNPTATNTLVIPTKVIISTSEAILTPTNITQQAFVTVANNSANLRSGPSKQFSTVGSAEKGDQLTVIASNGNNNDLWYLVKNKSGKLVWISNQVAQINNVNQQIQVAATIPSPPEVTIQPTSSGNSSTEPKLLYTFTGSLDKSDADLQHSFNASEHLQDDYSITPKTAGRIRFSCTGNPLTPEVKLNGWSRANNILVETNNGSGEMYLNPADNYYDLWVGSPVMNGGTPNFYRVATTYECRVYWLG